MRTKQIKVNDKIVDAVLVAGGKNFTIYTAQGISGWIVKVDSRYLQLDENHRHFEVVAKYVTLRYQPIKKHPMIVKKFDKFIADLTKSFEKEALSL